MLETTIDNCTQQLGFQEEITETGGMNTDIRTLLVLGILGGLRLRRGGHGVDGLDNVVILIVVNEIVVVVSHLRLEGGLELYKYAGSRVDKIVQ